jgi:hypothetical protein
VAGDDEVHRLGLHGLGRHPTARQPAIAHHMAAEADRKVQLGARQLPGIAQAQPVVGRLDLAAVLDALGEHAVAVAQAVAEGRHAQGGHRIQEAGGQATQPPLPSAASGSRSSTSAAFRPACSAAWANESSMPRAASALASARPIRNSIDR